VVYLPPAFTETREEVLIAHIERHDFGLLITHGDNGLVASQVPFLLERRADKLILEAHLARANPQVADIERGNEALAIFQGPHAYISPGWYETGPSVPTWNYASVHAYGYPRAIADHDWLDDFVRRLSQRHEAREPNRSWQMDDQPERYMTMMMNGIIGVELAVERLEGKFKLSQNRPPADRPRIIAALEAREDPDSRAVARLMREREAERS
jgi:transcriptional regulator